MDRPSQAAEHMNHLIPLVAQASGGASSGTNPLLALLPQMLIIFGIFYLLLIRPMRTKQKKLDALVKALKPGDKVVVNPGILATVVGVEDDAIVVRIDDKAKMRVLRSAVAGLQGPPPGDDKEKK
jgi:preprotein translocase subunit YajC